VDYGEVYKPSAKRLERKVMSDAYALSVKREQHRTKIQWFFEVMLDKLVSNSHKGFWDNLELQYLSMRLTQEREELRRAIGKKESAENVAKEAADVANFAMMIADRYRILQEAENHCDGSRCTFNQDGTCYCHCASCRYSTEK
jgi:hypothetical protein